MKKDPGMQLDFLESISTNTAEPNALPLLGLELDHHTWMRFLSDEWLPDAPAQGWVLGLGCAAIQPRTTLKTVWLWLDPGVLPDRPVQIFREGKWVYSTLSALYCNDIAIHWTGPLPLSAVDHFTVASGNIRAQLLAMIRNFDDIPMPSQDVLASDSDASTLDLQPPSDSGTLSKAPDDWDALRGAAAMAVLSVPTVGPWLELLCNSLFGLKPAHGLAVELGADWVLSLLRPNAPGNIADPLMQSILTCLPRSAVHRSWQPQAVLESVCEHALGLGVSAERIEKLQGRARQLLRDEATLAQQADTGDFPALVLLMLLLRPSPEQFTSWKRDWPAVPPGAWWAGATLSGLVSGFRQLPLQYRGSEPVRSDLAYRTWRLAAPSKAKAWGVPKLPALTWRLHAESALIEAGGNCLASLRLSNRGRWYALDLDTPGHMEQATAFASAHCPSVLTPVLRLPAGQYPLRSDGAVTLGTECGELSADAEFELALPAGAQLEHRLNKRAFHHWLATAPVTAPLPLPVVCDHFASSPEPAAVHVDAAPAAAIAPVMKLTQTVRKSASAAQAHSPEGLGYISGFLTPEEESALLAAIEELPWDASMARRVQHYGWRYDYKARKVNAKAYLGPLPAWAERLAHRLFERGLVSEKPDQVIVNEYVGNQGITKHVDCIPCFRGEVVTISLLESWEMLFTLPQTRPAKDLKYRLTLERGSAAVLSGDARTRWAHEIPRRQKEPGSALRNRRISITFRKVNSD